MLTHTQCQIDKWEVVQIPNQSSAPFQFLPTLRTSLLD